MASLSLEAPVNFLFCILCCTFQSLYHFQLTHHQGLHQLKSVPQIHTVFFLLSREGDQKTPPQLCCYGTTIVLRCKQLRERTLPSPFAYKQAVSVPLGRCPLPVPRKGKMNLNYQRCLYTLTNTETVLKRIHITNVMKITFILLQFAIYLLSHNLLCLEAQLPVLIL